MSEFITHIAVMEDCAHLAIISDKITTPFKKVLKNNIEAARLGSASRGNHVFSGPLLEKYRDAWDTRKPEDRLEEKLAFVLGWVAHRAADTYFKPRYKIIDKDRSKRPQDIRIYHDFITFDETYKKGTLPPLSPSTMDSHLESHPAASAVDTEMVEPLFGSMYQNAFIQLKTYNQKDEGLETWFKKTFDAHQDYYVDIQRYAKGYAHPDPKKVKQFFEEPNFYNPKDPIIQLVRALQDGKKSDIDLEEAATLNEQSQYAESLQKCYRFFKSASNLFTEDITRKQFELQFENDYYVRFDGILKK
ncbi:hypothetical protein [Flexithrix dorotheae]|uniref:hypothetical protein n=1 Tax=Flexithrix dorotheae TaxID=70993 RepID=UPI00036F7783|nr:hypothetical protein [Flexithrix dorotheae]